MPSPEQRVAQALGEHPDAKHYGYPLGKTARVRPGVLYPILMEFETAGWVESGWDESFSPRRRFYRVTAAGKAALDA